MCWYILGEMSECWNCFVRHMLYKTHYVLGKHFRAVTWCLKEAYLTRSAFHSLPATGATESRTRNGDLRIKWGLPYFQIFRFLSSVNSSNNFLPLLVSSISGHCIWNIPLLPVLPSTVTILSQVIIILMPFYLTLIKYPSFSETPLLFSLFSLCRIGIWQ